MKILYIHHGNILGGAPISLHYLTREIEKQPGVSLVIACHAPAMREYFSANLQSPVIPAPNPLMLPGKIFIGHSILRRENLRSFLKELWRMPSSIYAQYRLIKEVDPDIVHLNSGVIFGSAVAARLARKPLVIHVRESVQGSKLRQKIAGGTIRFLADAVIAISENEAQRLGKDRRDKVHVIYNPINTAALIPGRHDAGLEKQKLGLDPASKVILSLGGHNPRKGTLELVQAMRCVDEQTHLIFAGPPLPPPGSRNDYDELVAQAIADLPPQKVRFVGNIENIAPLLEMCDVLAFTGLKPHFPRPIFEAWQMHKPVVVFEMDGISTQVDAGVNGVIVPELTGEALGKALCILLEQPELMRRMGENGARKAQLCDPEASARQVMAIYAAIDR